jgi:hypothetical protein
MIYEKDQPILGFEPEEEGPAFPNHNPIELPKKRKAKMQPRRLAKIKRALIKYSIIAAILTAVVGYGTYKVNEWFNTHTIKWQSPIQTPVWVEAREPASRHDVITEAKAINFEGANFIAKTVDEGRRDVPNIQERVQGSNTEVQNIQTGPTIAEVVATVYRLESSGGKNDSCKKNGLYNGYGFAPGTCYKSHAEITNKVKAWFEKNIPKHGLARSLCGYNLGFSSKYLSDCINQSADYPYYRDFLTLN